MRSVFAASGPPSAPWLPPIEVIDLGMKWLGWAMYIALGCSMLAILVLGTLMVVDRNRVEPVGSDAYLRALRIAIGIAVISSAGSLAEYFF